MGKICAIISRKIKNTSRIQQALTESNQKNCQFSDKLSAEYEHDGEKFCLLHLPNITKRKKKLREISNSTIINLIMEGETNFNFVVARKLKIEKNIIANNLSFIGAWFISATIENIKNVKNLEIKFTKFQGRNIIKNCIFDKINFRCNEVVNYFKFDNVDIQNFAVESNYFHTKKMLRPETEFYSINFLNSTIGKLRFSRNKCEVSIIFDKCIIDTLNLRDNLFYLCPILPLETNDFKSLILPFRKDFDLRKFYIQYKKSPGDIRNIVWRDQYRKFRDLYNTAKKSNMYVEQSSYFSLMHNALEKTNDITFLMRIATKIYSFSNFGQNISRPLYGIISVWLISAVSICLLYNLNFSNSSLLSAKQIIKPYSFLYDKEQQKILEHIYSDNCIVNQDYKGNNFYPTQEKMNNCIQQTEDNHHISYAWSYLIYFLASTLNLVFSALILLALRWNFRKN